MQNHSIKLILFFLISLNFALAKEGYKINEEFSGYFNTFNCSQILNQVHYVNCYDYKLKGTKAVAYAVYAKNLKKKQIKKRPRFEDDTKLPKKYRTTWSDYKNSGFTRGHIAPNASFRFDTFAQRSTFLMSNITPQNEQINSKVWNQAEQRERELALKFQSVEVLNLVIYDKTPLRIKNNIAVPNSYIKIIKASNFKECYQIPNHNLKDENLKTYLIQCKF